MDFKICKTVRLKGILPYSSLPSNRKTGMTGTRGLIPVLTTEGLHSQRVRRRHYGRLH